MKKNLLLFLLMVSSVSFVYSQTPCVLDYQINNGGGSCPDLNGASATGTITLSFDGPVDPLNIPTIVIVFDITDPANQFEVTGVVYGAGILLNNGDVKYCYYVGPNNNSNLLGHNSKFRFLIAYVGGALCVEQATLPVKMTFFNALRSGQNVNLTWQTSIEENSVGFEVQRFIGVGGWQTISFVPTQAVNGSSSIALNYQFTDLNNTTRGITQYRLKEVDKDNRAAYSVIRAVRGDGQKGKTIVYPNPSSDGKVSILFEDVNGIRDVSVTDMSGRVIKQMKGVTNNNITIDNLAAGFYNVRIVNIETGEQVVEKFVVNKR